MSSQQKTLANLTKILAQFGSGTSQSAINQVATIEASIANGNQSASDTVTNAGNVNSSANGVSSTLSVAVATATNNPNPVVMGNCATVLITSTPTITHPGGWYVLTFDYSLASTTINSYASYVPMLPITITNTLSEISTFSNYTVAPDTITLTTTYSVLSGLDSSDVYFAVNVDGVAFPMVIEMSAIDSVKYCSLDPENPISGTSGTYTVNVMGDSDSIDNLGVYQSETIEGHSGVPSIPSTISSNGGICTLKCTGDMPSTDASFTFYLA